MLVQRTQHIPLPALNIRNILQFFWKIHSYAGTESCTHLLFSPLHTYSCSTWRYVSPFVKSLRCNGILLHNINVRKIKPTTSTPPKKKKNQSTNHACFCKVNVPCFPILCLQHGHKHDANREGCSILCKKSQTFKEWIQTQAFATVSRTDDTELCFHAKVSCLVHVLWNKIMRQQNYHYFC